MTQEKQKSRLEILEDTVANLTTALTAATDKIAELEKSGIGKKAGLFGGKRERTAMKDTKTGVVYISKSALGKCLATEADTEPLDHFAYYKLMAKFPDRFVEASAEEKAKVEKEEEDRIAKMMAEEEAKEAKAKAEEAKT